MTLAAAMLLGLTQCKKPTPWGDDNTSGGLKTVTFTVNDDSKGIFVEEEDGASARRLRYKWADGDKLYVYGSVNGDFESDGEFIGTLTTHNAGSYSALFRGKLDLKKYNTTSSKLRFYHFGSGVTFTSGAATSNLTSQDGSIGAVSSKVIACSDDITVKNESEYTSPLKIKFAVAKLDLTKFAAGESSPVTVKMKTSSGTQVDVSAKGVLTYSGLDGTCTLGGVSTSSNAYDVILLPAAGGAKVQLDFEANNKTCSGEMKVEENKFYYNKNNPNTGVVINAEGPQHLEGGFSIANGTKVQFSRGNLYNVGSEWGFMENQWNFYTYPGGPYCMDNTFYKNGGAGTGSFSWCLGGKNNWGTTVNGDGYVGESFTDYGGNVAGISSEWFTMTKDQWEYVTKLRTNADKLRRWLAFDKTGNITGGNTSMSYGFNVGAAICGLVLLPDGTENTDAVWTDLTKPSDLAKYNAVFLPVTGSRDGQNSLVKKTLGGGIYSDVQDYPLTAFYWSSTKVSWDSSTIPAQITFTPGTVQWPQPVWLPGNEGGGACSGGMGRAYRLVRLMPTSK